VHLLKALKDDPGLIVMPADKNLGPAIMERENYIQWVLREHLSNKETYRQIESKEAADRIRFAALRQTLNLVSATLPPNSQDIKRYFERAYGTTNSACITRSILEDYRMSQFYGMPKVHKNPTKLRPVISKAGNELEVLSKWLDTQLQRVVHLCPGYLRDNWELLRLLKSIGPLPANSYFVTADAISMYSNIETDHGIETMEKWFKLHEHELPKDYPTETILAGLSIVMRNNVFAFGDTFWLQLCGTAMGTSVACMYATVYYSYHEETKISPLPSQFRHVRILLNKRFIDDAYFLVTTHDVKACKHELEDTMNDFKGATGKGLEWEVSDLSKSVDFLDLTLTIDEAGRITSKTYQKEMNLYLYIPHISAHPSSVFDSFIEGQIRRYWLQNTHHGDFINIIGLFFDRLLQRGYPFDETAAKFRRVCKAIDENPPSLPSPKREEAIAKDSLTANRKLFLHAEYHPDMTSSRNIHRVHLLMKRRS
jgi:hypothetical protein